MPVFSIILKTINIINNKFDSNEEFALKTKYTLWDINKIFLYVMV